MRRLLMIDDDEKLVALTREYLEPHGFEIAAAHDGNAGVEAALAAEPALVILDLMLPGIDGLEVCRRLRQASRVPILMLTARGDETDRIVGLEMGADDYLPKPFNARELLARIRAILRRSDGEGPAEASSLLRAGPLAVDAGSRTVTVHGRPVELTTAEFDILHALELLREGRGGAERIADIEAEADALDALVEELLLASRLDLGSVPLELETLDLPDLCREAWHRVAPEAEARGMTLELRCADGRQVRANRSLAVRLLGNLFENSVRYAGQGRITVSSKRFADRLHVTVIDEGPGVEEADLERLFEPFFRADRSRSRKTGANGLGLMIVRRAVMAHGGGVRARRAEPQGLEVAFDLPAAAG